MFSEYDFKVATIMGHIFQQGVAWHQCVDLHFTLHGDSTAIAASMAVSLSGSPMVHAWGIIKV